ncbi:MAG: M23 family metallopeptidase [Corynebacterium sp.]|nr:M23 family metallopeptidase [Corynebacterium sp.]
MDDSLVRCFAGFQRKIARAPQFCALGYLQSLITVVTLVCVSFGPIMPLTQPLGVCNIHTDSPTMMQTSRAAFALVNDFTVSPARAQANIYGEFRSPDNAQAWPTKITRAFDPPDKPWLPGHRGVDLGMQPGDVVYTAGDGIVHFVGIIAGMPTISIQHGNGVRTSYQPVEAEIGKGEAVKVGQPIGILGIATQHPDLHWGAIVGPKEYMNPLDLLRPPTVYLVPLDGGP